MTTGSMRDGGAYIAMPSFEDLDSTGVYFLYRASLVVYVGKSINVRSRLAQHIADGIKKFDAVSFISCDSQELNRLERAYIEYYLPEYNRCQFSRRARGRGVVPLPPPPRPIDERYDKDLNIPSLEKRLRVMRAAYEATLEWPDEP